MKTSSNPGIPSTLRRNLSGQYQIRHELKKLKKLRKVARPVVVSIILAAVLCLPFSAQAARWTGLGGNLSWSNANNWAPTGAPGSNNVVFVDNEIVLDISTAIGTLTLDPSTTTSAIGGVSPNGGSNLTLNAGILGNNGGIFRLNASSLFFQSVGGVSFINGTGQIVMQDSAQNSIGCFGLGSSGTLTHGLNHTIIGSGTLIPSSNIWNCNMINKGTILADVTTGVDPVSGQLAMLNPLIIGKNSSTSTFTNQGILRAVGAAGLEFAAGIITNVGTGTIEIMLGSKLTVSGAIIQNFTLPTMGTGRIDVSGNSIFDGMTINGNVNQTGGTFISTGLTNNGVWTINSGGAFPNTLTFRSSSTVITISGTGSAVMRSNSSIVVDVRFSTAGPGNPRTLINGAGHTIRGAGTFTVSGRALNDGIGNFTNNGTIIADDPVSAMTIDLLTGTNKFTNLGTMQATGTAGLVFNSGLINKGQINIANGSILDDRSSYIQTAGTTTVNGALVTPTSFGLVVELQGGSLNGTGTVSSVNNTGGIIAPGTSSPGILNVNVNYSQAAGGRLVSEIGGLTVGTGFDLLAVSGTASLSGGLSVSLFGSFIPAIGDTFAILTASGGVSGVFDPAMTNFPPMPGKTFNISYTASSVVLTVVAASVDITAPVITLTGANPMTVAQGSVFSDPGSSVTDNVDIGLIATVTGAVNTAAVGIYTLTYNVSDAAGNAATTLTRTVNVADLTPPVIIGIPLADVTVTAMSASTAVSLTPPTATDLFSVTVTSNAPAGGFPVGTTVVIWTATDANGNTSIANQNVIVSDTTAPVITLTGGAVSIIQGQVYSDAGATALDNVDGNITVGIAVNNFVNTSAIGTYTVSYDVSDAAGNAAVRVIRTVTVVADQPPVISVTGALSLSVSQGVVYTDHGATAVDDVDGNITANITIVSTVDTAITGAYTVTYDVSDAAGNAATPVVRTVNVIAAGGVANRGEAVQVPLTGSISSVQITAVGEIISNFSSTPSSGTPPSNLTTPFGVLSYTTTLPVGATTQTINLSFSGALPAGFSLYKVDNAGVYTMIPNGTGADQWTQVNSSTIALTLTDGGQFDLGGNVVDGVIVDPVAVGVPAASAAVATSSGGGCVLNQHTGFDPLLPTLLLMAVTWLTIRRRRMVNGDKANLLTIRANSKL